MKNIYVLFLLVFLFSCSDEVKEPANDDNSNKVYTRLQKVNWILGTWQQSDSGGVFTETWKKQFDSVFIGAGHFVTPAGDTVFKEELQLVSNNDTLWYIPTVIDQNSGQPVRFMEKIITDTSVVFENLGHDFPQRIIYTRKGEDKMKARVEGIVSGEKRGENFDLTRKQ